MTLQMILPMLLECVPFAGIVLIVLGAFLMLSSALGIVRLPDLFSRLHAGGVGDSAGLPLICIGVAMQYPLGLITLKIILLMLLAMFTSATACHALGNAAFSKKDAGRKGKQQ